MTILAFYQQGVALNIAKLFLCTFLLLSADNAYSQSREKLPGWDKAKFGVTPQELRKTIPTLSEPRKLRDGTVAAGHETSINGMLFVVRYEFQAPEYKLNGISLHPRNLPVTQLECTNLYQKISGGISGQYGRPDVDPPVRSVNRRNLTQEANDQFWNFKDGGVIKLTFLYSSGVDFKEPWCVISVNYDAAAGAKF